MHAVAARAVCCHQRSGFRSQPVIAVHVGRNALVGYAELLAQAYALVAGRAGIAGQVARRHRRTRILVLLDGVDPMTVCADRRQGVSPRDPLAVDAGHERIVDCRVALAAGRRHIEFVDWRLLVIGGKDLVRAMAVGTHRGLLRAVFDGTPMHAVLIGEERLRALPVRLHQELLPVAAPARGWNIRMIYRRVRVVGRHHRVHIAMAIAAGGRRRLRRCHLRVRTVLVRGLLIGMTLRAGDLLWRRIVRQALHVGVAIHAREHRSVYGVLQLVRIHEQAMRPAVHVATQGGVAVTGEAVFVPRLVFGLN